MEEEVELYLLDCKDFSRWQYHPSGFVVNNGEMGKNQVFIVVTKIFSRKS